MPNYDEIRKDFTVEFLKKYLKPGSSILDLGGESSMSTRMRKAGYFVNCTGSYDLDLEPYRETGMGYDSVTAFEVIEHLVNPFEILINLEAPKLILSVPLVIPLIKPFRGKEERDEHYHEFYDWQLFKLLKKTGWKVQQSETLKKPFNFGIRPLLNGNYLLRKTYPRYIFVYAKR